MTLRFLAFLSSTAIGAAPLEALQPAAEEPAAGAVLPPGGLIDEATPDLEEEAPIVITGGRPRGSVAGDIAAQNILDSRDVRATGATSITELLDALAPQIGSAQGRGGERPVLLLNGQRISGFRELRDIPAEAIERVEILPEETALKYGYSASQKVVNFVLREHFRSTAVESRLKRATDGGYTAGTGDMTRLTIGRAGRTMVNLRAEGNGKLTESERDLVGSGQSDQAARTLLGDQLTLRGSATANRTILGSVSATLNLEAEHDERRSLLGLGTAELERLGRDTRSNSLHAGFALNGNSGKWHWSVTGNGDLDWSRTGTDRDDPLFTRDRAKEKTASADIAAVANGPLFKLPAGDAAATVRVGAAVFQIDGARRSLDRYTGSSFGRTQGNAALNIDLPISRRKRGLDALGDLTLNANAEVLQLSDFGTLTEVGVGANWSPVGRLNLLTSWSREEGAPSVQQLGSPVLETPDARIFDFVNGETVLAMVFTGGNPALLADRRRVWKLAANWQPFKGKELRVRGEYVRSVIDRPIQSLFGPTPALEVAFPDRFVRDSGGTLISADLRPINFHRARKDMLRLGFDFSRQIKSPRPSPSVMDQIRARYRGGRPERPRGGRRGDTGAPPPGSTMAPEQPAGVQPPTGPSSSGGEADRTGGHGFGGGGGYFGGRNRGRLSFSLTDTITFTDRVTIGPGLTDIDYLHGDAAGSSGGTPRHKLEAQAGWANNGLGARLSAQWRSGTKVNSLRSGAVRFSPLATLDLRLFANLGDRPEWLLKRPWLRGSSARLQISNIFNAKPRVRDSLGEVPLNYQPDLIDPLGRTVMIGVRKLFLPKFGTMRRQFGREHL